MKESYEEMVERHRQEITKLRDECSHDEVSDWKEYFWAPGHSTGTFVKICQFCQDEVAAKCCECDEGSTTECDICSMPFCAEHVKRVDYDMKIPKPRWRVPGRGVGLNKVMVDVRSKNQVLCGRCTKEVKVVKIHE